MADSTHVAIVGGGPGGLTLARLLTMRGDPALRVTVHERDTGRTARTQGGTLDLHADTGQRALRAAGLTGAFRRYARPEGEDMLLLDHTGTVLHRDDTPADSPALRPEIDRTDLRDLLLDSLPPGTVAWGRTLRTATPVAGEAAAGAGWRLEFTDGGRADCDVLIGADGAHSRLRPLLTPAEPRHLGVNAVEGTIPDVDRTRPDLAAVVGRGSYWVIGEGRSLAAQRCGDGSVRVGLTFYGRTDGAADWLTSCGIPFTEPDAARAALLPLFADWTPECRALIAACTGPVTPRPLTGLPVGLRWPHRPGLTLLGDAAHLMPPVGHGANAAMRDALELATALAAAPADPDAALRAYEEEMFARTAGVAADSARILAMITAPAGARGVAAFFRGEGTGAGPGEGPEPEPEPARR
ncbi:MULTISPECIES: NAD(P)/FAD-dependent oxidoreductase [Kitasatospora]|uniref:Flavin-dependent monooxygenase n=1 Tax=Kitasatospora setae (strain ATCC 33774 / DSM 43861 / JCM 3304 / KCC A-0304 / NBRC 14216 / KM-6054) TaxID=452652 RepID=E4N4L0_KITSK|nr:MULTISPECIES: NAD(P)/FAD-dependent oxidoreductase [Kitasatospora]BAJ26141.1 putative oxidoreductase [Kitasatospora setae KM-6054]